MRRKIITIGAVFLMVLAVAVAGEPNGFSGSIDTTGTDCQREGFEETVEITSFSDEDNTYRITFNGSISSSDPCHTAEKEINKLEEGVYEYTVSTVSDGNDMCMQCVGEVNYTGEFETDEEFELRIVHNGEHVETLSRPEEDEGKEEIQEFVDSGENWETNLRTIESSCHSGGDIGVTDHDTFLGGTDERAYNIEFSGFIETPNPCYIVESEVTRTDEGVYEYNIVPVQDLDEGEVCVECVGLLEYSGNFGSDEEFELRVMHDGEHVETIPADNNGNGEEVPGRFYERIPVINRVFSWFSGLF